MKNIYKLIALLLLVLVTGIIAMPESWKAVLPSPVREYTQGKTLRYGLDLAGGSQLDFVVDMTRVQEKIAQGEDISEDQIVSGVQASLQRRIDPDGTRELKIYSSDMGEEKHVFVELTADIDTPEVRKKLMKHIDLQFKEPKEEPDDTERNDARDAALEALSLLGSGETLEEIKTTLDAKKSTSFALQNRTDQKKFQDELPENVRDILWNTAEGEILPEIQDSKGAYLYTQEGGLVQREAFSVYRVISKQGAERITTIPGEDFDEVASEFSPSEEATLSEEEVSSEETEDSQAEEDSPEETISEEEEGSENLIFTALQISIADLPADVREGVLTTTTPQKRISEVLEWKEGFAVFRLIGANEASADGAQASYILLDSREEAESVRGRVSQTETSSQEDQLTYDEILIEITPDQWKETNLDGQNFKIAKVSSDQLNMPIALIEFDAEGAKKFEELTERLVGKPMAIFVGGDLVSAPRINEKISGGSAMITFGSSNVLEARQEVITLVQDLNTGAIPAPVRLDGELKVTPSLGEKSLEIAVKAGAVGFLLLGMWMIFSYRLLGVFAVLSLLVYGVLLFFLLKFTSLFVLTLAGIAGIILSVGMAVDANVLIFERMREELRANKNFSTSLSLGFDRAWTSIRDANITTLIVCGILYMFGTSVVKGFATMLAIGVILSLFTSLFVTRVFLKTLIGTKISRKPSYITKL